MDQSKTSSGTPSGPAELTDVKSSIAIDQPGSFYDHPAYYDIVFGSDWKAEYAFLLAAFEKHATGTVWSIFEPACGTGRLLYRLGKLGFSVSGCDLAESMVRYCNKRLARHGMPQTAFQADMSVIDLPGPVDASFNMINTFRHLLTQEQAHSHLETLGQAIRPGGLYILGMHLTPTKGYATESETWSASRGQLTVHTHLWFQRRDMETRLEHYSAVYDVEKPSGPVQLRDEVAFRLYTREHLYEMMAKLPMWELEAVYDFSYDIDSPIELTPETEDVVLILKRNDS